jgi:8-oxo-dGTP diphosphatase
MLAPIRIVAALVYDADGRTLLVRKRGTSAFMQPGGKLEADELPLAALEREIAEELGCGVDKPSAVELGIFRAPAANEPGRVVEAQIFELRLVGSPAPQAEIETIAWVDPTGPGDMILAPLTQDHVLPLAAARRAR